MRGTVPGEPCHAVLTPSMPRLEQLHPVECAIAWMYAMPTARDESADTAGLTAIGGPRA